MMRILIYKLLLITKGKLLNIIIIIIIILFNHKDRKTGEEKKIL